MKRAKVAFFSLTSCEGCQFSLLDVGRKFFNFLKKVDLIDFSLIEEIPFPKGKVKIDVSFVEGLPIRKEEIDLLKKIRKESEILVTLGNCATLGGIPAMKNYQKREKTIRYIYRSLEIENPEVKEIENFVKVEFSIPGCPIDGEEFLKYAKDLIKKKIPKIDQKPVCCECQFQRTDNCFLRKKEPCLGAIILGGCGAICPQNNLICYGCRGILENINPKGFLSMLEKFKSKEDIEANLEIFGIRDEIEKFL